MKIPKICTTSPQQRYKRETSDFAPPKSKNEKHEFRWEEMHRFSGCILSLVLIPPKQITHKTLHMFLEWKLSTIFYKKSAGQLYDLGKERKTEI